jgi:methionyl-tRNA formyltransferase
VRIVFLGNDEWSVPSLQALAESRHDLALVVTRVPRPAGRGGKLRSTPVAETARVSGLPFEEVETVKRGSGLDLVQRAAPDVLVVVAYGEILPRDILEIPRTAPVNVHFSLLPALRGPDPVRRAILDGLEITGVTTIRMDEGADTGPILLQQKEPIRESDDAGSLGDRLAELGGELLVRTLDRLEAGDLEERAQDEAAGTTAPKLRPEEEWLDWSEDARRVRLRVRALAPDPGARTRFRDRVLKVLKGREGEGEGEPGTIVAVSKDGLAVAASTGAVHLEEVLPEGRKRISGAEFVRCYRPEVGERLSSTPQA